MTYWQDKVTLVTGASAGLGGQIAKTLLAQGGHVIAVGRDLNRLQLAAEAWGVFSASSLMLHAADVTDEAAVSRCYQEVQERFGQLDLLVNCVGASDRGRATETTLVQFQQSWQTNFASTLLCSQGAVALLAQSGGQIINIGSLASKLAAPYLGAYPASKFAVAALSQQMRLELSAQGVHVMLVCPGPIRRSDAGQRYAAQAVGLPKGADQPGGGARLRAIDPAWLATRILAAARRRDPELVVPGKARWLVAISALWPAWGDRILRGKMAP